MVSMGVQPEKEVPTEGLRDVAMNKPVTIDVRAEKVLALLAGKLEAGEIVLGGYFALQHYADYRRTHDIDAWWKTRASPAAEQMIREAMQRVADEEGYSLRERKFGETVSFELVKGGRKEFSFQIAVRSVGLEEPVASAWPPVLIETLTDNIASKMSALVDRGAPRDFTDMKHVIAEGFVTVEGAWDLWCRKNPDGALESAKQKVLLQLEALESRRPLESIRDDAERERARETREWFKREFLRP
jgi:hypothetical protein